MNIRIVKRPFGEAPDNVRDAWIGLLLPVLPHHSQVEERRSVGVRSSPRSWLAMWLVAFRHPRKRGYMVDTKAAIDVLENVNPPGRSVVAEKHAPLTEAGPMLVFRGRMLRG